MILRKPYAFFIKHFRLIHVILSILMVYLLNYTWKLLGVINTYLANTINLRGQELVLIYTPFLFKILPILIILVLALILFVMFLKKKPKLLYIINIISNVYTFIIINVASNTLKTMETSLIDVRSARLIRDIVMISFLIQVVITIITLVRSVGFDIKKFDFKQDLKELEINEADREEFELEFSIDKNKVKRNSRRRIRFLKYAYLENKLLANIAICVFVFLIFTGSLILYLKRDKVLFENSYMTANGITLKINKSYVTETDYKGNVIDINSVFVVLKIDIKSNSSNIKTLDGATTKLVIGNFSYIPTYEYKSKFMDFGREYLGDDITTDFTERVLVYQIPKQFKDEKIMFQYVNKLDMKKNNVELKLIDLTQNQSLEKTNLTEILDFKDSILSSYKFKLTSFDISSKFKVEYDFCYNKKCKKSYEYLVPIINTNTDKALLKLVGTLESDNKIPNVGNMFDLINSFGKVYYTLNGNKKVSNLAFKKINYSNKNDNTIYIEVPKEIENASNISIRFKIRNKNYEYILK